MGKKKKSWGKWLVGEPNGHTVEFVASLSDDKRLYKYDIAGSIAHAQMLADQKLITKAELKQIKDGLLEIEREIADDWSKFDKHPELEDIHRAVDAALIKKIGEAGKKLHTGRSRNEQVATDLRLWMRDEIEILQTKITLLQKAFVESAAKYTETVMPGYTHLQRAQPVIVASYLLSFVERLERDFIRLGNCRHLLNISPLGSGALAGSTLPLDRKSTASQLGFSDISYNSIDAVSDRDFCAEFIFDCALIATHLSHLAEDWIIYFSSEFSLVSFDDGFCTLSSMMPQKRNLAVLELIRAKAGAVYGSLVALLTILKALPMGYNLDLQEGKVHVFAAADTVKSSLDMACAVVSHSQFNTDRISADLETGFMDATALAEYLVGKGAAFREAHGIVDSLVAQCKKSNKKLSQLSLDEFKRYTPLVSDDVYESLGAARIVAKYVTEGAAGPKQAKEQVDYWQRHLAQR
jgi:argininosuccinate lyase